MNNNKAFEGIDRHGHAVSCFYAFEYAVCTSTVNTVKCVYVCIRFSLQILCCDSHCHKEEMYDNESIEVLINMELTNTTKEVLGDPKTYDLPTQAERGDMERDLRKIKLSLLEYRSQEENQNTSEENEKIAEEAEQRKLAKLCILKYYDLLTSIYKRYCKIGRDTQWMTMYGWMNLLHDSGMIDGPEYEIHYELQWKEIFHEMYQYHHEEFHSASTLRYTDVSYLSDDDPWTGEWVDPDFEEQSSPCATPTSPDSMDSVSSVKTHSPTSTSMRGAKFWNGVYKFRKIGDRKLIGCILAADGRHPIGGWLKRNDFKRAKLKMSDPERIKDKLLLKCNWTPGESKSDPLQMRIEWEHKKTGGLRGKSGHFKLKKTDKLFDDDKDLPANLYVGLCRHEFFDGLLCVARAQNSQRPLYLLLHELVQKYLSQYVFKYMVDLRRFLKGQDIEKKLQNRLKHDSSLAKLFQRYSATNNESEYIEEEAWCVLAEELCNTAYDMKHNIWKRGGKPSMDQMVCLYPSTCSERDCMFVCLFFFCT